MASPQEAGGKTFTEQARIEHLEIALCSTRVAEMGHISHEKGVNYGIDGEIELVHEGQVLNRVLWVQSKAKGDTIKFAGETDIALKFICEPNDIDYWLSGTAPVLLVCSHPESGEAWFKHLPPGSPMRDGAASGPSSSTRSGTGSIGPPPRSSSTSASTRPAGSTCRPGTGHRDAHDQPPAGRPHGRARQRRPDTVPDVDRCQCPQEVGRERLGDRSRRTGRLRRPCRPSRALGGGPIEPCRILSNSTARSAAPSRGNALNQASPDCGVGNTPAGRVQFP